MLASHHRLTATGEFSQTVRRGQRAGGPLLVVHLLVPSGEAGGAAPARAGARAGFVVSRAVGPAVIRNRVKRRLRHLTREHLAALPDSALLVVRALPSAATADSGELGAELARCLRRACRAVERSGSAPRAEVGS